MYIAPGAIDIPETYYVPVFDIPDAFNITGAFDDIPDAFNVTGAFDDIPDAPNVTDAFDVPDAIDVLAFDVLDAFNVIDNFDIPATDTLTFPIIST
ncbi:unnamed protein product [Rhizophagus irregularis]|nr:unnamed protein product [Rhizophagus irregularis]CAB5312266.1 unnamed protein product [Rhizophagus irregularis]